MESRPDVVLSRYVKQTVKKKTSVSFKDKKDWINFTKNLKEIEDKDSKLIKKNINIEKIPKLDLHGFTLEVANKMVKRFIIEYYTKGYKKLLVITGKGLRSKVIDNPYISAEMSKLKYSVPEYIKNEMSLMSKIRKISRSDLVDKGEGSFLIFLKKK